MSNLSALDLLTVSAIEQDIIRCLIRTPRLTAKEIARRLRRPLAEVENTLDQMEGSDKLTKHEQVGQTQFQVPLRRERTNKSTKLLDSLFG